MMLLVILPMPALPDSQLTSCVAVRSDSVKPALGGSLLPYVKPFSNIYFLLF